jgi:hypothetical protein
MARVVTMAASTSSESMIPPSFQDDGVVPLYLTRLPIRGWLGHRSITSKYPRRPLGSG